MNRHERRKQAKLARTTESESKRLETNRAVAHSIGARAASLAMSGPNAVYDIILSDAVGLQRVMSEEEAMEVVRAYPQVEVEPRAIPHLVKGLTVGIGIEEQLVSFCLAGALCTGDSEKMAEIVRDFAEGGVGEGRRELEVMRACFTAYGAYLRQKGEEPEGHEVVEVLDRAIALYDFEDGTEPEGLPS